MSSKDLEFLVVPSVVVGSSYYLITQQKISPYIVVPVASVTGLLGMVFEMVRIGNNKSYYEFYLLGK